MPLNPLGATVGTVVMYSIYDGTDHLRIVGKVAPGLFAQEGRRWRVGSNDADLHIVRPKDGEL